MDFIIVYKYIDTYFIHIGLTKYKILLSECSSKFRFCRGDCGSIHEGLSVSETRVTEAKPESGEPAQPAVAQTSVPQPAVAEAAVAVASVAEASVAVAETVASVAGRGGVGRGQHLGLGLPLAVARPGEVPEAEAQAGVAQAAVAEPSVAEAGVAQARVPEARCVPVSPVPEAGVALAPGVGVAGVAVAVHRGGEGRLLVDTGLLTSRGHLGLARDGGNQGGDYLDIKLSVTQISTQ